MTLDDCLAVSPDVVTREVADETMLLDLASGAYFGLNPVGGVVWETLEQGGSLAEACNRIGEQFDAPREQIEADVLAIAAQFVEQGLASAG